MIVYRIHESFSDNYINHKMLKEIFPGDGKVLYQNTGSKLIVLSDIKIPDKFSDDIRIEKLGEDEDFFAKTMSFSIRMNPVKTNGRKRIRLQQNEVAEFVDTKLSGIGIEIVSRTIQHEKTCVSFRHSIKCCHASSFVTGVLKVKDDYMFRHVVRSGIGKAKAFGFGLLNVF